MSLLSSMYGARSIFFIRKRLQAGLIVYSTVPSENTAIPYLLGDISVFISMPNKSGL